MPMTNHSALAKDKRNAKADVMQHRHFAVVAGIIAELDVDYPQRCIIADQFARKLADTNAKFNRARFLAACGIN